MEAPENLVVIWTPAHEDTMPATVSAHTEKSQNFASGSPRFGEGDRIEYRRTDLPTTLTEALRCPEVAASEGAHLGTAAALAAAISLLEKGGKKAAPSDKMFEQMLVDYKASLERSRAALAAIEKKG